jgi:hypothetical protein
LAGIVHPMGKYRPRPVVNESPRPEDRPFCGISSQRHSPSLKNA